MGLPARVAVLAVIGFGWYALQPSAEERAEKRRMGFHCLSPWTGAHGEMVDRVKALLRDPASFEHIRTRVTPVGGTGEHVATMEFRARNGFGGTDAGLARGAYRNDGCALTYFSMD